MDVSINALDKYYENINFFSHVEFCCKCHRLTLKSVENRPHMAFGCGNSE